MKFLDTNILVYAHDDADLMKSQTASELILNLAQAGTGVLSTQVLGEFFQVVTRKLAQPLTPTDAGEVLRGYEVFRVVQIDVPMIHAAVAVVADRVRDRPFVDISSHACSSRSDARH